MALSSQDIADLEAVISSVTSWAQGDGSHVETMPNGRQVPSPAKLISNARLFKPSIPWIANTVITDATQPYSSGGKDYAPQLSQLPFNTGGTFNSNQFYLLSNALPSINDLGYSYLVTIGLNGHISLGDFTPKNNNSPLKSIEAGRASLILGHDDRTAILCANSYLDFFGNVIANSVGADYLVITTNEGFSVASSASVSANAPRTLVTELELTDAGLVMRSAPGGAKGPGTINAPGLYVNGVEVFDKSETIPLANLPINVGRVSSVGAALTPMPVGWTVARTAPGTYEITHNLGTMNYAMIALLPDYAGASPVNLTIVNKTSTAAYISSRSTDTGAAQDITFTFTLMLT